jgi:hypothetical protein
MATIRVVVNFRVRAGREPDLLEAGKTVKKLLDSLGVTLFIVRQVAGPETGNIIAVQQYSDWTHFAKVQSDREIAQFVERMRQDTNPPWESFTVSISEEVAL